MGIEADWLEPIRQPGFPPEDLCLSKEFFFYFLERELVQAERYGNYAAILLLRLEAGGDGEEGREDPDIHRLEEAV